jgi:hypothetical protein
MSREVIMSAHTTYIKSGTGSIIRFDGCRDMILLLRYSKVESHFGPRFLNRAHQFSGIKFLGVNSNEDLRVYPHDLGFLVSQLEAWRGHMWLICIGPESAWHGA